VPSKQIDIVPLLFDFPITDSYELINLTSQQECSSQPLNRLSVRIFAILFGPFHFSEPFSAVCVD
jgi:hypothetical protein